MPVRTHVDGKRESNVQEWRPAEGLGAGTLLPVPLTPFVGRRAEVASVLDILDQEDVRLVTLTGPGGAGKTRIAIEVASQAAPAFSGSARFVELDPITETDRLIPTIAREFSIPDSGDRTSQESLSQLIGQRKVLLVLDNFDQIVDAAPAIAELLLACPFLKVLVTSRIVLNIQGEHEYAVPPLGLPESGPGQTWRSPDPETLNRYDAIALFLQRARAAQPDFVLSDANSLAIVNICRRLDGLPLAIELAAARTKILSPEALLSRLSRSLDVLTGGARDLPPRLQTMRAAIAWSYELLDADEQVLLQQLAVFAGGFTIEAAEAVCGDGVDVLSGIASLTNNSLLRRAELVGTTPRFVMLETVREFGLEQLQASGGEQDTRARHARWVTEWLSDDQAQSFGPGMRLLLDRVEAEHDNLRAALRWMIENGPIEDGLQLASDSAIFWFYRGYQIEGCSWFEELHERIHPEPTPRLARSLSMEGMLHQSLSDFPRAIELTELSLSHAIAVGDRLTQAIATYLLGDVIDTVGEFDRAEALLVDAIALFREQNERTWLSLALAMLSLILHRRGEHEAAQALAAEGLTHARETGYDWSIAICLNRQGRFISDAGNYAEAATLYQESLRLWSDLGDRWRVTRTLVDVADCAVMLGQPDRAALLLGAAEALNEPLAPSLRFADDSAWRRAHQEAESRLEPDEFRAAWEAGRSLTWEQAFAEALTPLSDVSPKLDGTPSDEPSSAYHLSPRELEVLRLLVAGQTDREIAAALFISPRTAQGHVAGIFNKLGVNSRTAAVAVALQQGLIPSDDSDAT